LLVGVYEKKDLMFVAKVKHGFVPRIRDDLFPALRRCKLRSAPSIVFLRGGHRDGANR
jgi:hypothetical protein